jgi:hypothetical protein
MRSDPPTEEVVSIHTVSHRVLAEESIEAATSGDIISDEQQGQSPIILARTDGISLTIAPPAYRRSSHSDHHRLPT